MVCLDWEKWWAASGSERVDCFVWWSGPQERGWPWHALQGVGEVRGCGAASERGCWLGEGRRRERHRAERGQALWAAVGSLQNRLADGRGKAGTTRGRVWRGTRVVRTPAGPRVRA